MRSAFANHKGHPDENNIFVFQIEISSDEARIKEMPTREGFEFDKDFENLDKLGPDADIGKPYNEEVLISRIYHLIQSRGKLKNDYGKLSFSLGDLNTKEKRDKDFINNCLSEIYKGIESSDFNLIHLSRRIGMSRSSFYRKIKGVTGLKPVDFMKKAKLQYAAKRLLVNSDMRVCEIAWESGFSDIKYFSKLFVKEFGKLPSKFKGKSSPKSVFI